MSKSLKKKSHWTSKVHESVIGRNPEGQLGFELKGGAENGQFPYLGEVKPGKVAYESGSKLASEELLLEVNETPVAGLTIRDVLAVIKHCKDPLRLKCVKQGERGGRGTGGWARGGPGPRGGAASAGPGRGVARNFVGAVGPSPWEGARPGASGSGIGANCVCVSGSARSARTALEEGRKEGRREGKERSKAQLGGAAASPRGWEDRRAAGLADSGVRRPGSRADGDAWVPSCPPGPLAGRNGRDALL